MISNNKGMQKLKGYISFHAKVRHMASKRLVFLYEHATCTVDELPPAIAVEGLAMFKTLYKGFERPVSFYRHPHYLEAFQEHLDISEFALAIAPETGMELYRLTRLIEGSQCKNLGSSSKAVRLTSDKLHTYRRLGDLSPVTEVYRGSTTLEPPLIAKPRDGVSGEGIMLVKDERELERIPAGYLVQEYVPGKPMSASMLIGDEPRILSINTQELNGFQYTGAKLPVELERTEELIEGVAKVPGLFGYVGVDFVLNDERTVIIEINPRPTTPIIGLNYAFDINISELILRNYDQGSVPPCKPRRKVHIRKKRSSTGFISYKGRSICVEEIDEDTDL